MKISTVAWLGRHFSVRVVNSWNHLPVDIADFGSLGKLKRSLYVNDLALLTY